jgi:hypothetical protein
MVAANILNKQPQPAEKGLEVELEANIYSP